MKTVICLPTYNEKENIQNIIRSIMNQQDRTPFDLNILVIDDNSPDGTADLVRQSQKEYPANLHLITGEKEGLGAAYKRGFKHAIEELKAHVIMEMDADFSHDPQDIPSMLEPLKNGADFVIGSRYVPGGSIPDNWGLYRKLNSKVGNIFARFIAGLGRVKDCTAGFRAIKGDILKKVDLEHLRVKGYAFQVALLNICMNGGARVKEIPVDFVDRRYGETKMSIKDIVEFMINCWWIRLEKWSTFIKFAFVGASGVIVNLGAFTLLYNLLGMNKFLASPLAIELSILSNFLFNHLWTFKNRNSQTHVGIKGLMFNLVSILSLGISYGTFVLLSNIFPQVMPQISQAIGIIPATLVNYLLNNYWTFKDRQK